MNIIDLHCDTLLYCASEEDYKLRTNNGHISLEKLQRADVLCQCFAIFIPTNGCCEELGMPSGPSHLPPYEFFNHMCSLYQQELKANSDIILPAFTVTDILNNHSNGLMSSMLTIEDGVLIDNNIQRIPEVFNKGVRLITLTWNYENCFGYPNSTDYNKHMLSLKPFAVDALELMNDLGIIIDVSHLSEGGFYDVVNLSKKPFVASHSCARALCDDSRNLTDRQLKALGNCGGLVGANFYSGFLKKNSSYTSNEDIAKHVIYMVNKAGIESVGLGSDFDGIDNELEMLDSAGLPGLVDTLSRYFSDDELEKICYKNALRVMKDNFGK